MPVLNALYPCRDRALDLSRRIGVHGHVGIAVGSSLDARAELRLGERKHVQRGARRCNASSAHEFDLRGALEQLFAHA